MRTHLAFLPIPLKPIGLQEPVDLIKVISFVSVYSKGEREEGRNNCHAPDLQYGRHENTQSR